MTSAMMININYRIVNTCINCKYVFEKIEWDRELEHFCNITNDKPTLCGSCAMEESFGDVYNNNKYKLNEDIWKKWIKNKHVFMNGICDDFKRCYK